MSKDKKDSKWVKLFDICENRDGGLYLRANNYKGRLIWQEFGGENGDDVEDSKFYMIHTASLFEPFKEAPDFIKDVISVNLKNENSAEMIEA